MGSGDRWGDKASLAQVATDRGVRGCSSMNCKGDHSIH